MRNKILLFHAISICTILLLVACNKNEGNSGELGEIKENELHSEISEKEDSENVEQPEVKTEIKNTKNAEIEDIESEDIEVNNPEVQKEIEPVNLSNTYCTRYEMVNAVTCPTFQFDYTDNWRITEEIINDNFLSEKDVISNDRGTTITYIDFLSIDNLGGGGRTMLKLEISKVADSNFVPGLPAGVSMNTTYENPGNFIVAKIEIVGQLNMDVDTDYTAVGGEIMYAVLPESYIGIHEVVGLTGIYQACSFEYPQAYVFIAEAPDRQFTIEEEQEVIAILSSFRVVE